MIDKKRPHSNEEKKWNPERRKRKIEDVTRKRTKPEGSGSMGKPSSKRFKNSTHIPPRTDESRAQDRSHQAEPSRNRNIQNSDEISCVYGDFGDFSHSRRHCKAFHFLDE